MGAKRAGGGSANEFTAQRLSRYIMPGMTLTEANDLMGWKANFKQGMFYWTAQRGLLVQTKRMGNDVLDEAMIFSVFDFYRRKMYTLSKDRTTITIASIPAELLKRR